MILSRARSGFMLMDALMGAALFAVFLTAVGSTILVGQLGFLKSGDLTRGAFLAEQALEAVRSIRDTDWSSLSAGGPFGVSIGSAGQWEFSGTGTTTADGFTTSVTLTAEGSNAFVVAVTTDWNISSDRTGSVSYTTLVSDWREVQTIGDWSSISVDGSYVDTGTPLFRRIVVKGDYAFVTSDKASGGAGLYVFDVSNLSSPQRVASSFTLSGDGHEMALSGTGLFITVEDDSAEIQMFDISSPSTLSAADQIDTINLAGDSRARSVAYFNNYLYIGATEDATESEVYSFSASATGNLVLLDEFQTEGTLFDATLKDGYAFFASSEDVAELRVIDIFDPLSLQNAPGNGYNLTSSVNGSAVAGFGTGMFLGRVEGAAIEELTLFDIASSPVPSPPPGPFYHETGGDVNDIAVEPGGRYAFVATNFSGKELQIIVPDLLTVGQPAEATYYDSTNWGQGVHYDLARDRLFFVTNTSLFILQPS